MSELYQGIKDVDILPSFNLLLHQNVFIQPKIKSLSGQQAKN